MSEVYSYIGASIKDAEHVAWINVTNPLAESKIYDNAVNLYKKNFKNHDCLLSAIEVRENFFQKETIKFSEKSMAKIARFRTSYFSSFCNQYSKKK